MIYLASPYSHPDESVRLARFRTVCRVAGLLMNRGHVVFSPIAHTHPIALSCELPLGWDFWERYDRAVIQRCDQLWVLFIDGWEESKGVQAEIRIARELQIPVRSVFRLDWEQPTEDWDGTGMIVAPFYGKQK